MITSSKVMLAAAILLVALSSVASASITVNLFADTAPNAYGSPNYQPWLTQAYADAANGTFVNMRSGTFVGENKFIATEAIVYSTGDLGKRLHWIYWIPGKTVAQMNNCFQVKTVGDWDGIPYTYDWGTGTLVEDGPEVGWAQPTKWIDYNGGVIGTFGNAYWASDNDAEPLDTNGKPYDETDQADINALAAEMNKHATYWTGWVRYRESPSDPWTVQTLKMDLTGPTLSLDVVPESIYIQPGESITVNMNVADLLEKVNGCQAMLAYSSTYFDDPVGGCITAGGGAWDQVIWDSWKDSTGVPGEIDTAIGVNADGTVGTDADGTVCKITLTSKTGIEGTTQMVFRPDESDVESTFLSGMSGNIVWPVKLNSTNIYIDGTDPLISVDSAVEGSTNVLDGANTTLQGTVVITVSASDAFTGLDGAPTVTLVNGSNTANLTTTDTESPFHYTWVVGPTTANGTWSISATATDKSGNTASDTDNWLVVNKNQITGTLKLEGFVGGVRNVAFSINGGATFTQALNFTGDTASFTLVNVPDSASTLSAKTAWSLREKLTLAGGANNQWTADFVDDGVAGWSDATDHYLRAGDINASNSINILDYSVLKIKWMSSDASADINGDSVVNATDYDLMKINWFKVGDPQ